MMGELKSSFQKLRRYMLEEREREVDILLKIQTFRTPLLDKFFWLSSNFGEELFYITFLPFATWTMGLKEVSHMVALMLFFCVGLGNWLKNIFLIPRPPAPRVWTPETQQKTDHGFPSTHTISFVAAPIYFLVYQYYDKFYRVPQYPISFPVAVLLTTFVSGSVIFSRLYNGYHSPLDVCGGFVIGLGTAGTWYWFIRYWFDRLLMWDSIYAPFTTLCVCILMIAFHPRSPEPTAALPESGMLFGTSAGTTIGSQLSTLLDMQSILGPVPEDRALYFRESPLKLFGIRFLLGMIIVAILRSIGKSLFTKLVKKYYPEEKDMNWVITLVKFLNYFMISFAIVFGIPILMHYLGIYTDFDLRPVGPFPTGFPSEIHLVQNSHMQQTQ